MALLALWNPIIQFLKTDGTINAGGKIIVTDHNDAESIPANYSDADGTTLNSSPIVLDALGRATCYIDDGSTYDLYVKDANGATLWTVPEMTPGTETIVVRGGFSVSSNDRSVAVTISVDSDGGTKYDLSIQKEIDRAKEAEKGLADSIEAEKTRAEGVESTLSGSIAGETERATKAEKGLADAIDAEKKRAEEAERTLSESISKETERAIAAEKASRTEIVAGDNIKVDKTTGEDGHDIYTINGEKGIDAATANPLMDGTAAVGVSTKYAREDHVHPSDTSREDKANKTTVVLGTSDSKYPTDKAVAEFVNSSIATNTANYISNNGEPFTSVEQLEAYSGPVTNNDYAFVTGTDSDGNTYYDRYKATVNDSSVTWALEYRLNNSSFTAAQWSAINSGITSVLVAKIHDHSNKDVLDGITSDKVNSWDGKEDAFDILPTTKGGTGTNAASKSELTSTLINSLTSGVATPSDDDYYVSQFAGGGTTTTSYHRRPVSSLWNYIKEKISSVLGLTSSSYSGKAATAGTADKAVSDHSGNNIEETYATKTKLSTHTNDTTVHITSAERTAWNAKQDKVSGATAGDFVGLDANGNLTDSGHKHEDYALLNSTYGTRGYIAGAGSDPDLLLEKLKLGVIQLYQGTGVGVKLYEYDVGDEANAVLVWDSSTLTGDALQKFLNGQSLGTIYTSTAGKCIKAEYNGNTAGAYYYCRAFGIFMTPKQADTSHTATAVCRINGVTYNSYKIDTYGGLVTAVCPDVNYTTVIVNFTPSATTTRMRFYGFRCLNTYNGENAVLIGRATSALSATKATQDSDGNAINATYFKSSGNVTLVPGTATKIGTQNGTDVKLTLPTIPVDAKGIVINKIDGENVICFE